MRKEENIKKIIAIVLLVSIIFLFCFTMIHLNHKCTHDDCPICGVVQKYKDDMQGYFPNLGKEIIGIPLIFLPIVISLIKKNRDKKLETLVGLKVELLS